MDDLADIRRAAQEGQPVLPAQVLALCDEVERAEADVSAWWWTANDLEQLGCLDCSNAACDRARAMLASDHPGTPLLSLLSAARAWAAAIERQDIAEIERCANELVLAIARCAQG